MNSFRSFILLLLLAAMFSVLAQASSPLSAPRLGLHETYSRVAFDLPADVTYEVSASGDRLTVRLPGVRGEGVFPQNNPHVESVRYSMQGSTLVLELVSKSALEQGRTFRVGRTGATEARPFGVLYIDVGTDVRAQAAAPAAAPSGQAARPVASLRRTVVLDPGHGGMFSGAQGYVREEEVVLEIAQRVRRILEASGINVIMTRTTNTHLADAYRQDLVARAALATNEHNFFVSIHANSAANASVRGAETWIFGQPLDAATLQIAIRENGGGAIGRVATDEAISYASALVNDFLAMEQLSYSRGLAESVQSQLVARTGAVNRGVKQSAFMVLRQSRIPAILIEVGFVTNPEEGRQLGTEAYQQRIAEGIARGIIAYFEGGGSRVQN